MTQRLASCTCKKLQVRCEADPVRVSMCHCDDCQRRTGSIFSIAAFFPREAVSVEGLSKTFTRGSFSGKTITFHFCPGCGSTVFWEPERMPELIGVAVGAFADPSFPMPEQSVWTKDKHHWLELPEETRLYERTSPPRSAGDVGDGR
jgi:hypothetical protein